MSCISVLQLRGHNWSFKSYCLRYEISNKKSFYVVVGVGVDNMFILISAWRRSEGVTKETDRRKRVQARMAVTMQEAALSITITSLTGMLIALL